MDAFRPAGRLEKAKPLQQESRSKAPLVTAPLAPEPKSELVAPQTDWMLSLPSLSPEKKAEAHEFGEWLIAGTSPARTKETRSQSSAPPEGLLASLNLPLPAARIEADGAASGQAVGPELRKLDAAPAGFLGAGILKEACQSPQAAAALIEKQNAALATQEGRAQYASFLQSTRDDAELGQLYSLLHQKLTPEQEAAHLQLVAADSQTSAAQLGLVDSTLLKSAALSQPLAAALAAVQASALGCESGVAALTTLTKVAAAQPETAADFSAARASAAQSEPGRKALEGVYGGIAARPELLQAQADLVVQAFRSESGRQAVASEHTGAAQSPPLATQMVRVEAKTQSLPQARQIASVVSGQAELASATLAVKAAATKTEMGRSQLAEVLQSVARDPAKASMWAKTQTVAMQSPTGMADFLVMHQNLAQDRVAAEAYTSALTAAGVKEMGGLLEAAGKDARTSSLLLETVNQAPPKAVQDLIVKAGACPQALGSVFGAAAQPEGDVGQVGKIMQAASQDPVAASAALRAVNAGPTLAIVTRLAEDQPSAAATASVIASAAQNVPGRAELEKLLTKTAENPKDSQAALRLINAGTPEEVRATANGLAQDRQTAAALGQNLASASRSEEGLKQVSAWLEACAATPESARAAATVVNAPGPEASRELTQNAAKQPEAATNLGQVMTVASRSEEGLKQVSAWLEACAATPESARAAATVLASAGAEKAQELLDNLGTAGARLVANLVEVSQTQPEAGASTRVLTEATAQDTPLGSPVADQSPHTVPAAPRQQTPVLTSEPAAPSRVQPEQLPGADSAGGTRDVLTRAARSVHQSGELLLSLAGQTTERRTEIFKQVVAEKSGPEMAETISQAPASAVSKLLAQTATSSESSGAFLTGLSQARTAPLLRKIAEEPATSGLFTRLLETASGEGLNKFLTASSQDRESADGLMQILQHAGPGDGPKRPVAQPTSVAALTEKISQAQLSSTAFVKVVAQAPMESVRGMLANLAGDSSAGNAFVKVLAQAPPAAVHELLTRVAGDQEACESMVQALTAAAATPDGRAVVLSLRTALATVLAGSTSEAAQELLKLLKEATPVTRSKAEPAGDKASTAGPLTTAASTSSGQTVTRVSKSKETGAVAQARTDMGNPLHNVALGRYKENERVPGVHRLNVVVGASKTIKHSEETEESEGIQEVKKTERQRLNHNTTPVEEIQAIQLFERGQRRGHTCSRCGSQFEGRVASCPNCQGEMLELLAVNSVSYRRAGFLISTQTDLVEVTVAARNVLDTDKTSVAGMRSPQRFVTLKDLLAKCQQPVIAFATVGRPRPRRPKFD
ncbi:MAG: hypothetical protein U0931_14280 [Vulcanimicrobiota bacterium]